MAKKSRSKSRKRSGGGADAGTGSRPDAPSGKGENKANGGSGNKDSALVEWTKSLVVALILFLFIRTFLVHTFVIISGSMEETLLVGDLLLVNRAAVGSTVPGTDWRIPGYSTLERGDILVFDPPHDGGVTADMDEDLLSRCC